MVVEPVAGLRGKVGERRTSVGERGESTRWSVLLCWTSGLMPAVRRKSVLRGSLTEFDLEGKFFAVPVDLDRHFLVRLLVHEPVEQIVEAVDLLIVEAGDDVPLLEAELLGRGILLDIIALARLAALIHLETHPCVAGWSTDVAAAPLV